MVPRLTDGLRATTWAVAPLMAAVASSWIVSGTADAILAERRREARARQVLARRILKGADFDSQPEAYYLWLRLPGALAAGLLCWRSSGRAGSPSRQPRRSRLVATRRLTRCGSVSGRRGAGAS